MRTYFFILLLSTVLSFFLARWLARIAPERGWLRTSDDHVKGDGIPRLGGVSVFLSALITIGLLLLWNNQIAQRLALETREGLGLLAAMSAIFLVGLVDDLRRVPAVPKLLLQIGTAIALYYVGFRIELLTNPFTHSSVALGWLALPVTLLWLVGIANAFNLIDGLDGLAGGVSLFASLALFLLALLTGYSSIAVITLAIAGGLVGFLPHNFNPARIYLGDCGSLTVGMGLAALAISASQKGPVLVTVAIPLVIFGLPLLDVFVTTVRRLLSGHPLFSRDREHLHHRLLRMGLSERGAVLVLYGIAALFALGSLLLLSGRSTLAPIIALLCGVLAWLVVRQMQYAEFAELDAHLRLAFGHQHRMLRNQIRMRKAAIEIATAPSVPELWEITGQVFESLEFDFASCELELPSPLNNELLLWSRTNGNGNGHANGNGSPASDQQWALTVPLLDEGHRVGQLRLARSLGREPLLFRVSSLIEFLSTTFRERLVILLHEEQVGRDPDFDLVRASD